MKSWSDVLLEIEIGIEDLATCSVLDPALDVPEVVICILDRESGTGIEGGDS